MRIIHTSNSPIVIQSQFHHKYGSERIFHQYTITRLVDKFRTTGSVVDDRGHIGLKFTVEMLARVREQELIGTFALQIYQTVLQQVCISGRSVYQKE